MEHGFTTYDPATGDEEPPDGELTVIVAYAREGKPLGEDDGPLRLVVAADTPGGRSWTGTGRSSGSTRSR